MNTFTILLLILLIALVIAYFKKDKSLTHVQNQNDKDAIDIEAYKRKIEVLKKTISGLKQDVRSNRSHYETLKASNTILQFAYDNNVSLLDALEELDDIKKAEEKRIVDDRNKARDARREREEAEFTRHVQRESARKSSSHRTNTSWPSEFESSLNSSSLSDYDSVHRSSSSSDYSGGGGSFGGGGSGSSWSDSSSSSSSSSSD